MVFINTFSMGFKYSFYKNIYFLLRQCILIIRIFTIFKQL